MQWYRKQRRLYLKYRLYSKQSNKRFVDSHHPLVPGSSTFRHGFFLDNQAFFFLRPRAVWFGCSSFGMCFVHVLVFLNCSLVRTGQCSGSACSLQCALAHGNQLKAHGWSSFFKQSLTREENSADLQLRYLYRWTCISGGSVFVFGYATLFHWNVGSEVPLTGVSEPNKVLYVCSNTLRCFRTP